VIYPKGTLQTFVFSKDKKLNVYTDTVILRLPLAVLPDAPLGPQHLAMKLRYQACSTEICLPPVTRDVELTLNVVADRSSAKSSNPDLFPPPADASQPRFRKNEEAMAPFLAANASAFSCGYRFTLVAAFFLLSSRARAASKNTSAP